MQVLIHLYMYIYMYFFHRICLTSLCLQCVPYWLFNARCHLHDEFVDFHCCLMRSLAPQWRTRAGYNGAAEDAMVPAEELGTTMLGAGRCVTPAIRKEMPQATTWVEAWLSHC